SAAQEDSVTRAEESQSTSAPSGSGKRGQADRVPATEPSNPSVLETQQFVSSSIPTRSNQDVAPRNGGPGLQVPPSPERQEVVSGAEPAQVERDASHEIQVPPDVQASTLAGDAAQSASKRARRWLFHIIMAGVFLFLTVGMLIIGIVSVALDSQSDTWVPFVAIAWILAVLLIPVWIVWGIVHRRKRIRELDN